MTTRRDFLQATSSALAGLVFVGCNLSATPRASPDPATRSSSTASRGEPWTSTRTARCAKPWR